MVVFCERLDLLWNKLLLFCGLFLFLFGMECVSIHSTRSRSRNHDFVEMR